MDIPFCCFVEKKGHIFLFLGKCRLGDFHLMFCIVVSLKLRRMYVMFYYSASRSKGFSQWCVILRITGLLDFVHHPVFWKLENNISETGSVSVLR
jgi:hypothetical protein